MGRRSADPLAAAARALRDRDLSRATLEERLRRAGVGEEARIEALDRLADVGYLDDVRTASLRAARLAARGYGNALIEARLQEEALERSAIAAALLELKPESERALAVVASKRAGGSQRLAGLLGRRGFGADAIQAALHAVDAGSDAELA